MDNILGIIGAAVLGLIGVFVLRGRTPKDERPSPGATAWARNKARERAAEAARRREAADDQAIREVGNRPHTDDPVRDLEARLGSTRPHRDGDGAVGPPTSGDS